ncbi:AAA family ATPase [Desulforhopalus sp. 52FAK]
MTLPPGVVPAVYRDTGVPEYRGNPFIEALPRRMNQEQVGLLLEENVSFESKDIFKDGSNRVDRIASIVDKFFLPFAEHIRLEEKISVMIRQGYKGRNLQDGSLNSHLQNGYERIMKGDWEAFRFKKAESTALSASLVGCSGCGKSRSLKQIFTGYPQGIFHEEHNFLQIPYLKIDCPFDGSLKSLCINFFRGVDAVLQTNYEQRYALKRHSIEDLVGLMSQVANLHAIGILVIDEIQHLSLQRSGGESKMMNFFVNLVNVIGLPVFLVGTPLANEIFMRDLRSARRSAGFGALFWENMKPRESEKHCEWTYFANTLWKNQLLHHREEVLSTELKNLWYDLSQGVLAIVVQLFILCQARAIATGIERIDEKMMKVVYDEELAPVHPMLDALRSGDPEKIIHFSDIKFHNFEKKLFGLRDNNHLQHKREDSHIAERSSYRDEKEELLFNILKSCDIEPQPASDSAKRAFELHPGKNTRELVPIALDLCKPPISKTPPKTTAAPSIKQKEWHTLESEDLRYKFSQLSEGETMYDQLKKTDMIFDIEQWLE